MNYKYLIIGGGIAGTTAAETIRKNDVAGTICIITDEPHPLYSRVMLSKPNFFLGEIPFDGAWLKGKEWYEKNNIIFLVGKKAIGIDAKNKIVSLSDGEQTGYEKLLLATGVCARPWNARGAEKKGVYYLRTLDDSKKIISAIKTAKKAVTIGSGFVSFEMADLLRASGLEVTTVYLENYYWEPILDEAAGRMVEQTLIKKGVKLMRKSEVSEVAGRDVVEGIILKDGTKIPCDMIVCGIGAFCPLDCFKSAGFNVNRGVLTNEYLETNLPDVWAAGDVAEFKDLILDETVQLGNWVNASKQGRVAGLNMAGEKTPFKFVSFYTTQGFGISIAFVGDVRPLPDRIAVKRDLPAINSYARIIVLDKGDRKEVEGATLINCASEMSTIAKLIESNIDISQKFNELGDPDFDLKKLLN